MEPWPGANVPGGTDGTGPPRQRHDRADDAPSDYSQIDAWLRGDGEKEAEQATAPARSLGNLPLLVRPGLLPPLLPGDGGEVVATSSSSDDAKADGAHAGRVSKGAACLPCRRGRRRCDAGTVCAECVARKLECVREAKRVDDLAVPFDKPGTVCDAAFALSGEDHERGAANEVDFVKRAQCTWASRRLCRIVGYTFHELVGMPFHQFVSQMDHTTPARVISGEKLWWPDPNPGTKEAKGDSVVVVTRKDGRPLRMFVRRAAQYLPVMQDGKWVEHRVVSLRAELYRVLGEDEDPYTSPNPKSKPRSAGARSKRKRA